MNWTPPLAGFGSTRIQAIPGINFEGEGNENTRKQSMNEQSTQFKHQDPVRINSLKWLEGSKKPNILSQTTTSIQQSLLSLKPIKKLAKSDEPLFLAVGRPISLKPSKTNKDKFIYACRTIRLVHSSVQRTVSWELGYFCTFHSSVYSVHWYPLCGGGICIALFVTWM